MIPIFAIVRKNMTDDVKLSYNDPWQCKLDNQAFDSITNNSILVMDKETLLYTVCLTDLERYNVCIVPEITIQNEVYMRMLRNVYPDVYFTDEADLGKVYTNAIRFFSKKNHGFPVPDVEKIVLLGNSIIERYREEVMVLYTNVINNIELTTGPRFRNECKYGIQFTKLTPFWQTETKLVCTNVWYKPEYYQDDTIRMLMLTTLYKINRAYHTWNKVNEA